MAGETQITIVGNLVAEPELRFIASGKAVANFRVASTPRIYDRQANEFKDGESLFLTCTVWGTYAENVAESLADKGMRVIVQGRLKQRSYETQQGEKRTVFEVDVDEVGPALRSATAKVTKAQRQGGGGGFGGGQPQSYGQQGGGFSAPGAPAGGYQPAQGGFGQQAGRSQVDVDPWATPQQTTSEPPF